MAKGVNKVIIIGNVGDAPTITSSANAVIANFSVATSES